MKQEKLRIAKLHRKTALSKKIHKKFNIVRNNVSVRVNNVNPKGEIGLNRISKLQFLFDNFARLNIMGGKCKRRRFFIPKTNKIK